MIIEKKDKWSVWAGLICFFSVISQLPLFVTSQKTQLICFPIWIISFVLFIIISKGAIERNALYLIVSILVFLFLIGINSVINMTNYYASSLVYSLLISVFVFCVGLFLGKSCTERMHITAGFAYAATSLVISIVIFIQYFGFSYDFSSRKYSYASKNSVAQIIFTAIIILLLEIKPKKKLWTVLKYIAVAIEMLMILYLRSRAVILELGICLILILLSKNTEKRLKNLMLAVVMLGIIVLLSSDTIRTTLINKILLAGRDATNLDDLSSGRVSILASFPQLIEGKEILGIGPTYYECFPLSSILQFGIIPGTLLIIIACIPCIYSIKMKSVSCEWFLLFVISIGYLVNGLFEGLAPFGPGIKCFYMWFLFGCLVSNTKKES